MGRNPYRRADHKTRQAALKGYPARSVFKLQEIDRRVRLLKPGQRVLDLGAAPGSWSMYASTKVGSRGSVLAVDLQPIARSLGPNVTVLQGDALDVDDVTLSGSGPYDVVLSDMAPSTTGHVEADQARSAGLFLGALRIAVTHGVVGSCFVGKLFMGESFEEVRAQLRASFTDVRVIRPEATRRRSVEVFLFGRGKRG